MGPTERLERAIDRLTTIGWCQNHYTKWRTGRMVGMCAWGSLMDEPGDSVDDKEDVDAAARVVADVLNLEHQGAVIAWNDVPGRQLHEVIGALVMAAELSRKREFVGEPESTQTGELVPT